MRKGTIQNGTSRTNTGYKKVVLSPAFKVRPVVFAIRSGFRRDRTTSQSVQNGDIILGSCWDRRGIVFSITTAIVSEYGTNVSVSEQLASFGDNCLTFSEFEKRIPDSVAEKELILDYLSDTTYGISFLPAGLGWDGNKTLAEFNKEKNIRNFFSFMVDHPAVIDKIAEKAAISKKDGLPISWTEAKRMPDYMEACAVHWDGSAVDISMFDAWVLIYSDKTYSYIIPEPTCGEWGGNYAYSERGEYNASPVPIPTNVTHAIKITWGAYTREHHSYGIAWQLYKR